MTDSRHIYTAQAEMYHQLVAREDYQGNLLPDYLAAHQLPVPPRA